MTHFLKGLIGKYPRNITRQMCQFNNEINPALQTASGPDLLFQNLKNANNTNNVLNLISAHNKIMNNKHVVQALRSLFTLQKHGNTNYTTKEILTHPDFVKLCRRLKYQAGTIELSEAIEALKVVSYVGVPSRSTIVQVLLQLIRHNVNDLSLQQMIFLDFLLDKFNVESPLLEAIKIALPLVFEIQLPLKMNHENLSQLSDCLYYASKHNLRDNSIKMIISAILKHDENEFDGKIAKSIIWSVCNLNPDDYFEETITKCLAALNVHLEELTFNEMETTLTKLVFKSSKKYPFYYNSVFFDCCANYVIENDLGYRRAIYVLKKFGRISHINNHLIDYVSKKACDNPELILKTGITDIYGIAMSVSMTDYKPVHWDGLKKLLEMYEVPSDSEKKEIHWLKFMSCLCLANIFKPDLLEVNLNSDFLDDVFHRDLVADVKNYLIIWQAIMLYKPEMKHLLSNKYTPETLIEHPQIESKDFPLEQSLKMGLGGESYVKTGLLSKMGCFIDHVIIFRKGGYPVANNENVRFLEDLDIASGNQLPVVVQCLDNSQYTLNNMRMKSSTILSLKFLESKGYIVVPICLASWQNLPDFEKIPFLMQKINEKLNGEFSEQHII